MAAGKTDVPTIDSAELKELTEKLITACHILDHEGVQHKLQFHHLFPKAILKSNYTFREIDDIANLSFISGEVNRKISKTPPADYMPATIKKAGSEAFDAQCIPTDSALLDVGAYKDFLAHRRILIAERLNEFLGTVSLK